LLVGYHGVFRCGERSHNQPRVRFGWNRDALVGICAPRPIFKKLQATPVLRNIPLPIAVPYLQGLDLIKYEERMGIAWGNIYMAGNLRVNQHDGTLRGFPGYYFYAALFKVPIAKQIIFLLALLGFLFRHGQRPAILRRDELLLLVPIFVYWGYFNFFSNAQIGIRHVLPVFAVATVFCGRLLADPASKLLQLTALMLTAWVGLSTLSYYPHFLSYFNELVPDRKLAYRYLADSNLDWGGNRWYLAEHIRRHSGVTVDPDYPANSNLDWGGNRYLAEYIRRHSRVVEPGKPQTGLIVVPVNALVGVGNPEQYRWLGNILALWTRSRIHFWFTTSKRNGSRRALQVRTIKRSHFHLHHATDIEKAIAYG
jgi:hypothetical protein